MNLELFESFGQSYPEEADGQLECSSMALACSFNRRGSLLAVGCNDGRVIFFDFITRGAAKTICAHVHPVCTISWSRNGRKVLTASTDNTVAIWDVLSGDCGERFRFPGPVLRAQFHPRDEKRLLVSPLKHAAVLLNLAVPNSKPMHVPLIEDELGPDVNIVASFDRKGNHVITGNGKGKVCVFATNGLQLKASFRLPSNHAVKLITVCRRTDFFLTLSQDRAIRVYSMEKVLARGISGEAEPVQKLQDLVNKTPWKTCCFSGDSEYVCAASASHHSLYIWERGSGSLVKILHGTKGEQLLDLTWHPLRPVICSIANGVVTIWAQSHVENWSAFAPDFKELDENAEYEERESEFDLEDEDKSVTSKGHDRQIEDVEVDVVGTHEITGLTSSDDEDEELADELWYLPVAPEIDNPEESTAAPAGEPGLVSSGPDKVVQATGPKKPAPSPVKAHDVELVNAVNETHPMLVEQAQMRKRANQAQIYEPKTTRKQPRKPRNPDTCYSLRS